MEIKVKLPEWKELRIAYNYYLDRTEFSSIAVNDGRIIIKDYTRGDLDNRESFWYKWYPMTEEGYEEARKKYEGILFKYINELIELYGIVQ